MTPLRHDDHLVVVGAGLAGWRFCEVVRQLGFSGEITLIGAEDRPPYDRPPLSKQILAGKWEIAKATLASAERLEKTPVTLRLGSRATALDVEHTRVELDDGTRVAGTHVVIATGSLARSMSFASSGALPTLRTADDAERLNALVDAVEPGATLGIIGGGFLGAEAATSWMARGLHPVVLEAAARPLLGVVGEEASEWLIDLAPDFGVELHTRQTIRDVAAREDGYRIEFEGRDPLEVSLVLAAVGSVLDLEWLSGSGLTLDHGVVVDENLQAATRVAALGDVARFPYRGDERIRVEHWQVAADHAWHLAHHWMGHVVPPAVPYFWSDQYGKKIQMLGHPRPDDQVVRVMGGDGENKWLALYAREGIVTGVLSLSNPRALATSKILLDETTTLDEALRHAPWTA